MILIIVMTTIILVGLAAIALAHPRPSHDIIAWNDELERKLLVGRKIDTGWW